MPRDIVALVALVALASLASAPSPALAQVSNPVHHDRVVTGGNNKFLDRQTLPDTHDDDEAARPRDECPANVRLRWMTEVSSSVYATPVIADLHNDGHRQIVVPSFVHHLEVLEGENGARAGGAWPAFHKSTVHASPVVVDTRARGLEIMLPTYDGQVLFFDRDGDATRRRLTLPPLPVKRNWYVHLAPDHVDHSAPDVGAATQEAFASGFGKAEKENGRNGPTARKGSAPRRRLLRAEGVFEAEDEPAPGAEGEHELTAEAEASFAVFGDEDAYAEHAHAFGEVVRGEASDASEDEDADYENAWLGADGEPEGSRGIPHGDARQGVGRRAPADLAGFAEGAPGVAPPTRRARARAPGWEDESFTRPRFTPSPGSSADPNAVLVDAHLLCTPAVADVDGDGRDEIVLAVSYFFDKEYYDNPRHRGDVPEGVDDLGKYVANAIVVVDYETLATKWRAHLDLSTDTVSFRAYMYGAPTPADLDGDGRMEIVVGTSVGFLYVLRGEDGSVVRGWPKQMGEIQGQVAVADVDGDGEPELVAADTRGSVAAFRFSGEEAWETHLASLIAQGVTIGDVDGDGRMEVVVGTSSGAVHVLRGDTGAPSSPFPFRTGGRVMSPVLLTNLRGRSEARRGPGPDGETSNVGLTLVVTSFDGYVYVIDGARGCYDVLDIGETSYGSPLADDVTGSGSLSLVVATMNGNVYAFESADAPYDPLNAWTAQTHASNNVVARGGGNTYGVRGIERTYRDTRGTSIRVPFEILDARHLKSSKRGRGPYSVTVTATAPGFVRVVNATYDKPGRYVVTLDAPRTRSRGRVSIRVSDRHKLFAEDAYAVSFHARFYRALKWLLALPFAAATAAVITLAQNEDISAHFATNAGLIGARSARGLRED